MRLSATLAALALSIAVGGCAEEPPPPGDPLVALSRVTATIEEARRLDGTGQKEDAREGWRRALMEFERDVEPALRARLPAVEVAAVEMRFGALRAAIERREGSSRDEARDLIAELARARAVLEAPPGEVPPPIPPVVPGDDNAPQRPPIVIELRPPAPPPADAP